MPQRLQMRGIGKSFGSTVALDGVDLTVESGEVLALVGENGAGKSTLMKILSGAHPADFGDIILDGMPYCPRNPLEGRKAGVAMIYQELSLAPHLSVEENILLGMEPSTLGFLHRASMRKTAINALEQLGHPDIHPGTIVGNLSVAAQQLVEIARAIAVGCKVLVLDEPTSSLARGDVERLFKLVERLKAQGHAIIYISHFIEEVKRVSDRFVVLRDGRSVGGGAIANTTSEQIVAMMVGRDISELYPRSSRTQGEPILEVKELAGITKPSSASFTLHRGEVLGIAGLVGAGRTEMIKALFGLDSVRNGRIRIGSYSGTTTPVGRWNQGMGLLSEDRKNEGLALSLSIADNMTLSKLDGLGPSGLVIPSRQNVATDKWIKQLDIRCRQAQQPIGDLSGGNQQKVALARLLHHDVDVLLLDEPTRGIDVASKALIYRIIDDLAVGDHANGRAPKAILIVSSYLPELLGVCDRIAVMHRGRLGKAHPVSEVNEQTLMLEATGSEETVLV